MLLKASIKSYWILYLTICLGLATLSLSLIQKIESTVRIIVYPNGELNQISIAEKDVVNVIGKKEITINIKNENIKCTIISIRKNVDSNNFTIVVDDFKYHISGIPMNATLTYDEVYVWEYIFK